MPHRQPFFLSAGLVSLLFAGPESLLAQDTAESNSSASEETTFTPDSDDDFTFTLTPKFRHTFDADIDDPSDSFSVYRTGIAAQGTWNASESTTWVFDFGYEFNGYQFDGPNTMIAGTTDPFSSIHILDGAATAYFRGDDRWTWIAGGRTRVAGESDVDIDDAITFGGHLGAMYAFEADRRIGFGVFATSQIEDDVLVVPIVQIDWRLDDTTRLVGRGTRGEIVWELNDSTDLALGAAWEHRRFRLDDDPIALGAVVDDTSVPIFLRLMHQPDQNVQISLTGGVIAWQEFEVANRHGRMERDFGVDPTGFIGFDVRWTF